MRQVAMHAMDYIDTATIGIISPHVFTVEDLWKMLIHIEKALCSPTHLPFSSEDTLMILMMKQKQWKFQNSISFVCQQANRKFCSINIPLQPLANPPSCIAAIYTKSKAGIEKRCSLQIRNMNSATIQTPIAPNVWILTSAPTAVSTEIMLIYPDKAPRFIKTQTPIHILHLPPAHSATSQHFHLPPHYESHQLTINIYVSTQQSSM